MVLGAMKSARHLLSTPSRLAVCWRRLRQTNATSVRRLVGVDLDVVVVDRVGRQERDHRVRGEPAAVDHPLEHRAGRRRHAPRRLADHLVVEDRRIRPVQVPGLEERPPVDVARDLGEVVVAEQPPADELGPAAGGSARPGAGPAPADGRRRRIAQSIARLVRARLGQASPAAVPCGTRAARGRARSRRAAARGRRSRESSDIRFCATGTEREASAT